MMLVFSTSFEKCGVDGGEGVGALARAINAHSCPLRPPPPHHALPPAHTQIKILVVQQRHCCIIAGKMLSVCRPALRSVFLRSMASVSAADVKILRDRTGAPMLDCKEALKACDGDTSKAIDWLRQKGISKGE